uniref:DNA-directed RNA polymerase I subunit RPA12 n=1 Tax=Theileria annulata TaxID=5874 RepID=A0A3B0MV79_THEAN
MDELYESCERGEEIFISPLDPLVSQQIANINVNEASDMVNYLYSESQIQFKGKYITDFKFKLSSTNFNDMDATCSDDQGVELGYDYLVSMGCRNCGSFVDFNNTHMFFGYEDSDENQPRHRPNKFLRCENCNSIISPIFTKNQSDSFYNIINKDEQEDDKVYLYGMRSAYIFDDNEKQWWKDSVYGSYSSNKLLQAKTANKSGKQTVKYNCEKCGHDTHLYSTFQARSADEGMSIMYECIKCKNRVVIST